jgi:hypothetical protein
LEFRTKYTIIFLVLTYVLLNCCYYFNYIIFYTCMNLQILCIENLQLCVWNPSCVILFLWRCNQTWVMDFSFLKLLDHTQRLTTIGRTPLDEWSARRRDLYLAIHNTYNRQHVYAPGGFLTHDLSRRASADLRLRPRGHWDRHILYLGYTTLKLLCSIIYGTC